MLGIKEYNQKIGSLKSTQKITSAMKMIAAAKLRKAEKLKETAGPFWQGLKSLLEPFLSNQDFTKQRLFAGYEQVKKVHIILFTSDRGLCGAFNSNVNKKALSLAQKLQNEGQEVSFSCVGRRGYEFVKKRGFVIDHNYQDLLKQMSYESVEGMMQKLISGYSQGTFQEVWIVRNEFISAISRKPITEKLLPLEEVFSHHTASEADINQAERVHSTDDEFIFEPSANTLIEIMLPKFFQFLLFYALLDSLSSEYSARMTAMDAATRNCNKLIDQYTLLRNRARQAAITKELIEIVAGKEALQ